MTTTAFPPLSASVTRILSLSGFSPQLRTRDIQAAFADWENVNGGFKIKWIDDTNLLIVFADAGVAKRAYLQTLACPHPILTTPTSGVTATVRPYDGADAQTVILAVNSRASNAGNHRSRQSISAPSMPPATLRPSGSETKLKLNGNGFMSHSSSANSNLSNIGREPSPTLPNIPNQPTLNSLISSSLSPDMSPIEHAAAGQDNLPADSAIVYASPPKIGDPGKRMVGAALGIKLPGLGQRTISTPGGEAATKEVQKAMAEISVSD